MQVNLNNHAGPVQRPAARPAEARPPEKAGSFEPSFDAANALNVSLHETPEVRSEIVEKARKLISDTNYPPEVAIRKISTLLAMNLQEGPEIPSR